MNYVALFTRAWIEMSRTSEDFNGVRLSPSLRGRGLKSLLAIRCRSTHTVALFTRAWIEIVAEFYKNKKFLVALFTRAWIEINTFPIRLNSWFVALFTRAWIEI